MTHSSLFYFKEDWSFCCLSSLCYNLVHVSISPWLLLSAEIKLYQKCLKGMYCSTIVCGVITESATKFHFSNNVQNLFVFALKNSVQDSSSVSELRMFYIVVAVTKYHSLGWVVCVVYIVRNAAYVLFHTIWKKRRKISQMSFHSNHEESQRMA